MKALITKKVGMTNTIAEDGTLQPVTLLSVEENTVIFHKTTEKDGYNAIQIGYGTAKKLSKSLTSHVSAAKVMPKIIREFKIDEITSEFNVGQKIKADIFSIGDKVSVIGTSKGKGWAGTIKRHNFHRGRKTHGGRSYRRPGSIGSMYPQRIFKGKKMAGQMGHKRVTVRNLQISLIDNELSVIGVSGAVPGPRRGIVLIMGEK